uniref:Uncharacterized protein n=1 Tax=Nelumbo nucifera TaxID=4432 RepID=A0A822ZS69_NELNU|nr:TPA_asm: hypothetical protein HUJ06_018029 [Nelumbo nucifera]
MTHPFGVDLSLETDTKVGSKGLWSNYKSNSSSFPFGVRKSKLLMDCYDLSVADPPHGICSARGRG